MREDSLEKYKENGRCNDNKEMVIWRINGSGGDLKLQLRQGHRMAEIN